MNFFISLIFYIQVEKVDIPLGRVLNSSTAYSNREREREGLVGGNWIKARAPTGSFSEHVKVYTLIFMLHENPYS